MSAQGIDALRRQAWAAAGNGQPLQALALLQQASQLAPGSAQLRCELGRVQGLAGQADAAVLSFQEACRLDPRLAEAWHFLGVTLARLGRLAQALPALRRAYELAPGETRALQMLASAEFEAGEPARALPLWRELDRRQPGDENVQLRLGEILNLLGENPAACTLYRQALTQRPDSAPLWMALAQSEEIAGDRGAAVQAFERALELRPGWPPALAGLLGLERAKAARNRIDEASAALADARTPDADLALLGYELGKVHDGRGEHTEAMAAWHAANSARRREAGEPDLASLERRVDASIALFDGDFVARAQAGGNADPRPVFVVGMPRSGTTLLERILDAHPLAVGAGELPDLPMIARGLPVRRGESSRWPHLLEDFDPSWVAPAASRYLHALTRNAPREALRIVDKYPLNTYLLGLAAVLFPQARFIWCRRDPRDIAISIYGENFALAERLATTLDGIGHLVRLQEKLMRHWQGALRQPVLELHYEDLVQSPEAQVRRVLAHCDLDWDPACLDFHQASGQVQTPSRWQVRQPVHTRSVGRWKPYAADLAPMLAALGRDPDAR